MSEILQFLGVILMLSSVYVVLWAANVVAGGGRCYQCGRFCAPYAYCREHRP